MSVKTSKINSSLLRAISYVIATEVKNKNIKFVTVTAVDTSTDLSFAKVYVTTLDTDFKDTTIKALNQASSFIRSQLFDRVDLRNIPELKFVYDDSIEYGTKIENIIDNLKK